MTLLVLENVKEPPPRKLLTLLGTDIAMTNRAWINLPLMLILGIVLAFIFAPTDQMSSKIFIGIGYGLMVLCAEYIHGFGHILSSRIANAPVKTLVLTATVGVTLYDDAEHSSRVHVWRALGGPILNLIVSFVFFDIYNFVGKNHFMLFFAAINLLFGVFTLLPIPTIDGSVVWRELRNWKQ